MGILMQSQGMQGPGSHRQAPWTTAPSPRGLGKVSSMASRWVW